MEDDPALADFYRDFIDESEIRDDLSRIDGDRGGAFCGSLNGADMPARCQGYRRYGGMFTLGPVKWVQCENDAVVILEVSQESVETFPACMDCWSEAIERKISILSARPIERNSGGES